MQIQSPLSNLREVLLQVQEAASTYKKSLLSNEDATRAALVDPVIRALGWNIGNPNMVEVEKTLNNTKQSRVDYALFDGNGAVKAIVEAKPLSQNLGSHVQQLVQYAFGFQVTSLFLTNGLVWHHYTQFSPNNFAPTRILDLSSDDLIEVAAYLVQELDAAKFWQIQPDVDVLAQDVNQLRSDLTTLQQQIKRLMAGHQPLPLPPPPPPSNWIDLNNITDAKKTKPSSLRLPDDTIIAVKYWRDVLTESTKFVLAQVSRLPIPLSDKSGMTVNLLDTVKPSKGSAFVTAQYNGQNIYIYANYEANKCVANALYILSLLPKSQHMKNPAVIFAPI